MSDVSSEAVPDKGSLNREQPVTVPSLLLPTLGQGRDFSHLLQREGNVSISSKASREKV